MRLQENHELIGDTPDGNLVDFGRYCFLAPLSGLLVLGEDEVGLTVRGFKP
jgi:hypothetical protein